MHLVDAGPRLFQTAERQDAVTGVEDESLSHLLPNLVDEDQGAVGGVEDRRQLAERLAHQPRLREFFFFGEEKKRERDVEIKRRGGKKTEIKRKEHTTQ